jgi:phosphoglycerate dehydrogenase-like enzyme
MKNKNDYIAVCSRSFSSNPYLRKELLSRYKNVKFNEKGKTLKGTKLLEFLSDSSKAIIGLEKIDENLLSLLPNLKLISKYGVGIDNIDLNSIKKHKKKLVVSKGVNKRSVSELIILLILNLLRHTKNINKRAENKKWKNIIGNELSFKTVGIVGFGSIGRDLANILKSFHCNILYYDIEEYGISIGLKKNVKKVSLNQLLKQSDIVSLNLPLTSKTYKIINKNNLKFMKKDSILINAARGGLVCETSIEQFLRKKKIAAAAFDVFEEEPPKNSKLLKLDNFFATTHIGSITKEGIRRMGMAAIKGLK